MTTRLLIASLLLLALTRLASAHAILVDSVPALAGTVPAGPLAVRLRYNSRIDHARSRVALTRPDGSQLVLALGGGDPPDVLSSRLDATPGAYVLRWQVLAVDGHITRGEVGFTVAAPGP